MLGLGSPGAGVRVGVAWKPVPSTWGQWHHNPRCSPSPVVSAGLCLGILKISLNKFQQRVRCCQEKKGS